MLQPLDCRERGLIEGRPMALLMVPQLPLRLEVTGVMPISEMVGDEVTELADDVLPKRRWVEWWWLPAPSQNGQLSSRFSQP